VFGAAPHQFDFGSFAKRALHDADVDDDALESVEMTVVDKRL